MSEKRFKSVIDEETMSIMPYLVSDKEEECFYNLEGCVDLLNEQQATISQLEKNFDDLVKWASEISKRNVVLDEKIGKIQRENEQLQKELGNFKPVMFQDVRKGTVILYSKVIDDE